MKIRIRAQDRTDTIIHVAGRETDGAIPDQMGTMNDKPPSTGGTGSTGIWSRVKRAIKGEPWSREEIQDLLQQSDSAIDPEEQDMLTGVLEVAERTFAMSWFPDRKWWCSREFKRLPK